MIDTELLERKIAESGKRKNYLAAKCGLSYAGFQNCVTNRSEFRLSHVSVLCDELGITRLTEKEAVFFKHIGA